MHRRVGNAARSADAPASPNPVSNSASIAQSGRAHIKLDGSSAWSTSLAILRAVNEQAVSGSTGAGSSKLRVCPSRASFSKCVSARRRSARGRARHLFVPPFNGPKVRRRGRSYTGVELPEHRQTQLLDRLILDGVREFGDVAESHGSLGNWVLILRGIVQINHVIVGVCRLAFWRETESGKNSGVTGNRK